MTSEKLVANFLNVCEAARYLNLSQSTLNHWRVIGGGPKFVKAGCGRNSRVTYRIVDLDAWAAERTYESTSGYGCGLAAAGGRG